MNEQNLKALQLVAEDYEKRLVPALFSEWAPRLADAVEISRGEQALDVACGTGVLTRVIAERVGSEGSVFGLDANPAMLAVANRIQPEVEWVEGNAESLPFENDRFDVVFCQFGLMLFSSPRAALQEMHRVLRPGGRLAAAVFNSLDNMPAYEAMAKVYERVVDKSVSDALRVPFSLGDTDALDAIFTRAGFVNVKMITEEGRASFSSVREMVLADARGWFPFAGIHLDEQMIDSVSEQGNIALQAFQTYGGGVEFQVPVHMMTATKGTG